MTGVRSRAVSNMDTLGGESDQTRGLKEFRDILQAVYLHIER